MTYEVQFDSDGRPAVTEVECFGMVLGCNPLGKLPQKDTSEDALLVAIEYGNERIRDGRERLKKAAEGEDDWWGNAVLLLAQEIRAVRAMEALNEARKHWKKKD